MINREIIQLDNLLTYDEIKLFESELLELDKSLEKETAINPYGTLDVKIVKGEVKESVSDKEIMYSFSRIYLDDIYKFDRRNSNILNIIDSKLFSNLVLDNVGVIEPLLRLIRFSNNHESQYTVYDKGGNYVWHVDSIMPYNRIANFILYLNDDFEGGELELSFKTDVDILSLTVPPNPPVDLVITPKKNMMVVMPSDMWHRVRPITKGKRRTINGHIGFK